MKRLLLLLCLLLAVAPASAADLNLTLMGVSGGGATSTYTGPIDVVASPTAWYGLRAGSGAIAAAGTQKLVNVRRASDNVACDFLVASSGDFGVTTATCNSSTQGGVSYASFVGTDATASCTIAATSAACTGASATLHVGDLITGVGITNPCIVTATNGSTTATVSLAAPATTCGTVSVAETVTFQVAGFLPTVYDQSGNAKDVTQGTAGTQPQFLTNCKVALPCIYFSGSKGLGPVTITSVVQQWTGSTVANQHSNAGSQEILGNSGWLVGIAGAGAGMYAGIFAGATSAIDTFHATQYLANGASSVISVDNTETTVSPGTGATGTTIQFGGTINSFGPGYVGEAGLWPSGFSSGNRTSMCGNQRAYWGTPGSC